MVHLLTDGEKHILLNVAREAIEHTVRGKPLPPLPAESSSAALTANGASFVTLTLRGNLRGCIGALEAYQPLIEDVREHAIAAAMQDPRFDPVHESELPRIHIEVSRLTEPQELEYASSADLLAKLHPHVDGVILKHRSRRATFLPQVWEKIPDPAEFLNELCHKMGERGNLWRETKLQVYTYQVEEFHELN